MCPHLSMSHPSGRDQLAGRSPMCCIVRAGHVSQTIGLDINQGNSQVTLTRAFCTAANQSSPLSILSYFSTYISLSASYVLTISYFCGRFVLIYIIINISGSLSDTCGVPITNWSSNRPHYMLGFRFPSHIQ